MYKLTIVSGPNRGTSYAIQDGENAIGRQSGNVVVLQSSRVSKKHCTLIVDNDRVVVKDEGSANGTFVNGTMAKMKSVAPGDRISVGEFVLELSKPSHRGAGNAPPVQGLGDNVVAFPGLERGAPEAARESGHLTGMTGMGGLDMRPARRRGYDHGALALQSQAPTLQQPGVDPLAGIGQPVSIPQDPVSKLFWVFDKKVMPFFYGMLLKNEWRFILIGVFGVLIVVSTVLTVQPLLDANRASVLTELNRRARFIAQQLAEANVPVLQQGVRSQAKMIEIKPYLGVRVAALIDLYSNSVITSNVEIPGGTLSGVEGRTAARFAKNLQDGTLKAQFFAGVGDDQTVVAVEPVRVFRPQQAREVVEALAVVSINSEQFTAGPGEWGMAYSQTLLSLALAAALALLVLYKLTLKPFQVLNDDIDKVLKGEIPQVTHEFKLEELNALWDVINAALRRVPQRDSIDSAVGGSDGAGMSIDDAIAGFRLIGEESRLGILVCDADRKVIYMNPQFEEISGIRSDNALGQLLTEVVRDQAFGALSTDLFDRATPGADAATEEFDFSGVSYGMKATAIGLSGSAARGFVLCAVRNEAGG